MASKIAELYGTAEGTDQKLAMLKQAAAEGKLADVSATDLLDALSAPPEEPGLVKLSEEKQLAADTFGRMMAHQFAAELEAGGAQPAGESALGRVTRLLAK